MIDRFRWFVLRNVIHPLDGLTLGAWVMLLWKHRFAIDPPYWGRASVLTLAGLVNSIYALIEELVFGRAIKNAVVQPPVFILGHYRSGTTHLHNLLALDPQFAFPNLFQAFNPRIFLCFEWLLGPLASTLLVSRRAQDNMALAVDLPTEDEMALCVMTQLSPYLAWCFSRTGKGYGAYLTFRDATPAEVARWRAGLTRFLKKLTLKYDRPLLLKSPPHTARIRLLLDTFPEARFVHIHREPFAVFRSTLHLHETLGPVMSLQRDMVGDVETVLSTYTSMYDAFFEERSLIPLGRYCEVAYEDLEGDPSGSIRRIYETLGLPGFEVQLPRLESYLGSIAGYQKNRHAELPDPLRERVTREWSRSFREWGYSTD